MNRKVEIPSVFSEIKAGKDLLQFLDNLADSCQDSRDYREELRIRRRIAALHEEEYGREDLRTAEACYFLTECLMREGEYEEALEYCGRAIRVQEQQTEQATPDDLGRSYNLMSVIFYHLDHFDKARSACQRALKIAEKDLGPDHPHIASALNNLAQFYCTQGEYDKAEPLFRRSLKIKEASLDPNHPDIAATLNNLAELYSAQGRYKKAEPLYKRDLKISETTLGFDHPDVATTLNNLSLLYCTQGEYDKAAPLLKRALAIWEKTLPPDHPNIATTLENYAVLLFKTEWETEGREMLLRASSIRSKRKKKGEDG